MELLGGKGQTSTNSPNIKITAVLIATEERCSVLWESTVGRFLLIRKVRKGFSEWHLSWNWKWRWDTFEGSRNSIYTIQRWEEHGYLRDGQMARVWESLVQGKSGLSPAKNDGSLFGNEAGCFANVSSLFASPGTELQWQYARSRCPWSTENRLKGVFISHSAKINWTFLCAGFWTRIWYFKIVTFLQVVEVSIGPCQWNVSPV